jgi:hypothetical protein
MNISFKLLLLTCCQIVVALVFLKGFLLTRIELPDVSQCASPACSSQLPPYGKAVVLIVDAVRYDFLCGKQVAQGELSGSLMPKTLSLVQAGVSASCLRRRSRWSVAASATCEDVDPHDVKGDIETAPRSPACFSKSSLLLHHWYACILQAGSAVASRFVADTPTITMSRLKALLTVRQLADMCLQIITAAPAGITCCWRQMLQHRPTPALSGNVPVIHPICQNVSSCCLGWAAYVSGHWAELFSISHH